MLTVGISPKLIAAVVSAVAAYLLTQTILELPPLVVLLIQVGAIIATVWKAGPGRVIVDALPDANGRRHGEAGNSLVEVLAACFLGVLLLLAVLALLDRV
jgi:hypothetical protein